MKTFTRGTAKTATIGDLYGQNILDVISKTRRQAFENYERLNGPTMYITADDVQLGIDGLITDLTAIYKKYQN